MYLSTRGKEFVRKFHCIRFFRFADDCDIEPTHEFDCALLYSILVAYTKAGHSLSLRRLSKLTRTDHRTVKANLERLEELVSNESAGDVQSSWIACLVKGAIRDRQLNNEELAKQADYHWSHWFQYFHLWLPKKSGGLSFRQAAVYSLDLSYRQDDGSTTLWNSGIATQLGMHRNTVSKIKKEVSDILGAEPKADMFRAKAAKKKPKKSEIEKVNRLIQLADQQAKQESVATPAIDAATRLSPLEELRLNNQRLHEINARRATQPKPDAIEQQLADLFKIAEIERINRAWV